MAYFHKVALLARKNVQNIVETITRIKTHLLSLNVSVFLEQETAQMIGIKNEGVIPQHQLYQHCDLILVIGGDGSLIQAAHIAVDQHLPVVGVNRGYLGFLTDILPDDLEKITQVINGEFLQEQRLLLNAQIISEGKTLKSDLALNEIALLPGDLAHMIEFDIYINGQLMSHQRADGLIVATPTGSTAYALSGGGPILHPQLNAIVLVPMFPHNISSRPVVVQSNNTVELVITKHTPSPPFVSCDGLARVAIPIGSKIKIVQHPQHLQLIHPRDYEYFATLREKLGWENTHKRVC